MRAWVVGVRRVREGERVGGDEGARRARDARRAGGVRGGEWDERRAVLSIRRR